MRFVLNVWEWHTESGWAQIPGSEDAAANGLEISPDERWLYIAGWREEKLTRLSRGQTPVQKQVVPMGFRPDNFRMAPDGSVIFAAGHGDYQTSAATSNVARIDPETLSIERIFQHPRIEGFTLATTAVQIGGEIWLGTNGGEMIVPTSGQRGEKPADTHRSRRSTSATRIGLPQTR